MKPQYLHAVVESFYLWADHKILSADCYRNVNTNFHQQKSPINSLNYYSSPYAQFVADTSITGVTIPSGVNDGTGFNTGVKIDYVNGGLYSTTTGDYSTEVSIKDFNVYMSNEHQSMVFLNQAHNGEDIYVPYVGSRRNSFTAPCILISPMPAHNSPFALGGTRQSTIIMGVVVITDNYYNLLGLSSLFNDTIDESITRLDFGKDSPYNIYGSIKSGNYNYLNAIEKNDFTRPMFIKDVVSKGVTPTENKNNKTSFISLINFTIEDIRL